MCPYPPQYFVHNLARKLDSYVDKVQKISQIKYHTIFYMSLVPILYRPKIKPLGNIEFLYCTYFMNKNVPAMKQC